MSKNFEEYWEKHQKNLILNAPEPLRSQYVDSNKLDTPMDWLCFVIPIGVGIFIQSVLNLRSELLSWAIVLVIVVVLFAVMQLLKPYITKKKTTEQVISDIKNYYYKKYQESGDLNLIDPMRMK